MRTLNKPLLHNLSIETKLHSRHALKAISPVKTDRLNIYPPTLLRACCPAPVNWLAPSRALKAISKRCLKCRRDQKSN